MNETNSTAEQLDREVFHVFENERPRIERSHDLNVILKRLGIEEPTNEDIATVTRWADAHVSAGLSALRAAGLLGGDPTEGQIEQAQARLAAEIHEAWEFQYDECDHGTYRGGHMNGEPYAMCEITAERIVRRRAAAGVVPQEPSDAWVDRQLSAEVAAKTGTPAPSPDREKLIAEAEALIAARGDDRQDSRLLRRLLDALAAAPVVDEAKPYRVRIARTARQTGKTSDLVEHLLKRAGERDIEVRILPPEIDEAKLAEAIAQVPGLPAWWGGHEFREAGRYLAMALRGELT